MRRQHVEEMSKKKESAALRSIAGDVCVRAAMQGVRQACSAINTTLFGRSFFLAAWLNRARRFWAGIHVSRTSSWIVSKIIVLSFVLFRVLLLHQLEPSQTRTNHERDENLIKICMVNAQQRHEVNLYPGCAICHHRGQRGLIPIRIIPADNQSSLTRNASHVS